MDKRHVIWKAGPSRECLPNAVNFCETANYNLNFRAKQIDIGFEIAEKFRFADISAQFGRSYQCPVMELHATNDFWNWTIWPAVS